MDRTDKRLGRGWLRRSVPAFGIAAALVVAGCGSSSSSSSGSASGSGSGSSSSGSGSYTVAVLYPGTCNDGSWGQAWCEGTNSAAQKYGAKVTLVGNLNTPDQYLAQASAFGSKGYKLVIIADGGVGNADLQASKQFPNTKFLQGPFTQTAAQLAARGEPANLGHFDVEQEQGAFFAGALAGLVTKTNKIASVNGFAFPALTRQAEAFSLGARCVNSNIQFSQKYINSWDDTALAQGAAQAFISSGADVLFSATDQATEGMYNAAKSAAHPTYIVPSYFDSHSQSPSTVLTSVLYNLQGTAESLINTGSSGKLTPHFYADFTYQNLAVGKLAPYYNLSSAVPAKAQAKLAQIKQAVLSGKITIPKDATGSPTIGTPGSGAKINVTSLGCTPSANPAA
jgi:basic membrane protein A